MPTITNTQVSTENILARLRTIDLAKEIEITNPGTFPLVQFMKNLRRKPARDTIVRWGEDEYNPQVVLLNDGGAIPNGDPVTYTLDDTSGSTNAARFLNVNDIVLNVRTRELLSVNTVDSDTTATFARSFGSTALAQANDDDEFVVIGPAIAEGAAAPAARTTVAVEVNNQVQEFRHSYQLTDTEGRDITLLTENDLTYQRAKRMEEHFQSIERAIFFGDSPSAALSGDSPRRALTGINEFITTTRTDPSGTMTETEWLDHLRAVYRRGSGNKWHFGSARQMQVISGFGRVNLRVEPGDTIYGINTTRYISPFGTTRLILEQIFSESVIANANAFDRIGFTVDMDKIWLRVLADTMRRENIQSPDETRIREEYISKYSLELRNEAAHAVLLNVTG